MVVLLLPRLPPHHHRSPLPVPRPTGDSVQPMKQPARPVWTEGSVLYWNTRKERLTACKDIWSNYTTRVLYVAARGSWLVCFNYCKRRNFPAGVIFAFSALLLFSRKFPPRENKTIWLCSGNRRSIVKITPKWKILSAFLRNFPPDPWLISVN